MTQARQALGMWGEELACRTLEQRGYRIVERRYRTRAGEIDVVAWDGECLTFIEVKAREDGSHGEPEEAVTDLKQQKLVWMATDYLARHGLTEVLCRFDVVSVRNGEGAPTVVVIADAFRPGW